MPVRTAVRAARGFGGGDDRPCPPKRPQPSTPGSTRAAARSSSPELGAVVLFRPVVVCSRLFLVALAIIFRSSALGRRTHGARRLARLGSRTTLRRTRPGYLPAFPTRSFTRLSDAPLDRARLPDRLLDLGYGAGANLLLDPRHVARSGRATSSGPYAWIIILRDNGRLNGIPPAVGPRANRYPLKSPAAAISSRPSPLPNVVQDHRVRIQRPPAAQRLHFGAPPHAG